MTPAADLPVDPAPPRRPSARTQVALAFLVGVVTGVVVGVLVGPSLGPVTGIDAAAIVYLVRIWITVWPLNAEDTAALAVREDPTRGTADLLLLLAAVGSLAAVGIVVAQASGLSGGAQTARTVLAVGSIVVSWLLVHTVFMLKYARLYYSDRDGGVDFKTRIPPPYSDFAYLSFTVGMTFQVSDTDLQRPAFRRLALRHALLSYLFGTVIVAATINLIAGLAH